VNCNKLAEQIGLVSGFGQHMLTILKQCLCPAKILLPATMDFVDLTATFSSSFLCFVSF